MLDAIAPVRLGAVEGPIGFHDQRGEILIPVHGQGDPDADGRRLIEPREPNCGNKVSIPQP